MPSSIAGERDEFADEPGSDGRRQHKYSTADMKRSYPWKRWLSICLCFLIVVAIMVVISIYFQKLFNPPEDSNWGDDAVNATDAPGTMSAPPMFPKDMQYVEDVCSKDRLSDPELRGQCVDLCSEAKDCCDPYVSGNGTCFDEQISGCYTYSKCHVLNGKIDPANNDLDRLCAKKSLEVNRDECVLACESVSCCYSEVDSCISTNFEACMDYSACQNLKEMETINVAAPDLGDRCAKKLPTCQRDCREAQCCSDPHSACYRDNFIACLSYASCNGNSDDGTTITVAPIYSRVDPAPDNFDKTCSKSGISKNGPTACLEACQPAKCCYDDSGNGCFGDDPLGCLEYERCKILQQPQYAGLTLPPSYTPAPGPTTEPAPSVAATSNSTTIGGGTVAPSLAPLAAGEATASPTINATTTNATTTNATTEETSSPTVKSSSSPSPGPLAQSSVTRSPASGGVAGQA